jgi:HPt (histidine-containing phosphotransfer) domain-containing protein
VSQVPRDAEVSLAAIRAVGGEELVRAMLDAFGAFASAQVAWIERQHESGAFDGVAEAARALRISASQVGAMRLVRACESAELAGHGHDAAGTARAIAEIANELAAARPWMDAPAAS